jgi:hypothetical protein
LDRRDVQVIVEGLIASLIVEGTGVHLMERIEARLQVDLQSRADYLDSSVEVELDGVAWQMLHQSIKDPSQNNRTQSILIYRVAQQGRCGFLLTIQIAHGFVEIKRCMEATYLR